jgi:hypothetical protein
MKSKLVCLTSLREMLSSDSHVVSETSMTIQRADGLCTCADT